jgi:hypothetical protein
MARWLSKYTAKTPASIQRGWPTMGKDEQTPKPPEPTSEPEDSERSRFARFAKKLVQVPKKEIDEKGEEWKRERGRKR